MPPKNMAVNCKVVESKFASPKPIVPILYLSTDLTNIIK
jgi:hypothetical protein